ncbi:hypothetical protein LBMAG56_16370 [Verrucomicrobiota bacterium]|nr:hypothetical protein LBMAG56_16370 [Verrucomicrobiota bacterium]
MAGNRTGGGGKLRAQSFKLKGMVIRENSPPAVILNLQEIFAARPNPLAAPAALGSAPETALTAPRRTTTTESRRHSPALIRLPNSAVHGRSAPPEKEKGRDGMKTTPAKTEMQRISGPAFG